MKTLIQRSCLFLKQELISDHLIIHTGKMDEFSKAFFYYYYYYSSIASKVCPLSSVCTNPQSINKEI